MSGVREDLGMPLFIGISVISFLTLSMIYFFDISMTNDLLLNINSFSPFIGIAYVAAGSFFGSPIRIGTGLSLAFISIFDLGIPESLNSSIQILLVIIGALTPF